MLLMLLTTATAGALPSLGNPSLQVAVETQNGASGTVSVSYTNTSGTSVTNQDITSGETITTSSSAKSFTLTITPAAGCEIKEFRRAQGDKNISYPDLSENNGVFTYTGSSTTNPYTYTITFGPKSDYYFVHFDPGLGGEGTMASQAILKGGTANLTPCTFTGLNGMVFDRWTTNLNGTGTSYVNGASITLTSTITLYAQWMQGYTVHFDANGGTGTMVDQSMAPNASAKLTTNTFTRTGYVFAGWNTEANGSGTSYTDGQSVTDLAGNGETVTLYAQWTPTYTVHFDANGGTGTMADQTFVVGKSQKLTANVFTRENYIFVGWNTQSDGTGTSFSGGASVINLAEAGKTITLYAQWTPTYTVHFDANGGEGTMADQTFGIGLAQALTANAFTRENYIFVGWNTVADGNGTSYTDGESVTGLAGIGETVTLYAQWTPTYTVHFDANGGEGTMADQTFGIGLAQALTANAFTREGYYFDGWNTQTDGLGATYDDGASVTDLTTTPGATVNLFAKWGKYVTADYVDASGEAQTMSDCKEITPDHMPTTLSGNYIVSESVTYTSKVTLSGNTTIILANGKTMSIGTEAAPLGGDYALYGRDWNSLTIYGRSLDAATAGSLEVYSSGYSAVRLYEGSYTQHSSNVKVISNNNSALNTGGSVTIDGGKLDASITSKGSFAIEASGSITIGGGSVTANATGADSYGMRAVGNITLSWTRATDCITASGYQSTNGTISLSKRFAFSDGGTVTQATTANMAGKTLRPAVLVTFDANGGSDVAVQPVIIGTAAIAPTPTRTGYDLSGWTLGGNVYDFATAVTDDITLTAQWTENVLELANATDNTDIIADAAASGKTYNRVTLQGRTLYKDGAWNTICLPFNVTIANSPLAGADARALSSASLENEVLTLNFTEENGVTELVAGTPYLIKWAKANDYVDDNAHNIVNPVFSSVVINSTTHDFTSTDGKVSFKGTYSPIVWNTENKSILFVGENATLYYPKSGAFVNACRAYFELSDDSQAREFVMNFDGENEVNGVKKVKGVNGVKDDSWYTVNGVKLSGKPTKAGLYIHNGKKVIIK